MPSPLIISIPISPEAVIRANIICIHAWYRFAIARRQPALFAIPSSLVVGMCCNPSHGGSYVVEGRLLIRIGLCPRRCSRGLASWSLGRRMCYLVRSRWLCVVSCVPPSCRCPCTIRSDSAVIWGCISMYYRLVIMRVGVRLHGTLYPMTDCVLYLGQTIVWAVQSGSADVPQASLRFYYH